MAQYPGVTAFKRSPHYTQGRAGHSVRAVVLHITEGAKGSEYPNAINWFMNPASKVSAHFVTSPAGDITQCVDTSNTAYANGLSFYIRPSQLPKGWSWQGVGWYNPRAQLVKPTWQLIQQGVNPNYQTVSIEHAGQSGHALPAAQWHALYTLLRWLGTVYPQLFPYTPGKTLIGHYHLDPLGRAGCPGAVFDLQAIADVVNSPTPKSYQALSTANIRAGASTDARILGQLTMGQIWAGTVVHGGMATHSLYGSSDQWVRSADGRYVWRGLLREV